jgi:hypothetical protein
LVLKFSTIYSDFTITVAKCRQEWELAIKKAVITAAAKTQPMLPLQTHIAQDGNEKSLLRILIEQSLAPGIENIPVVVFPGDWRRSIY